ncbi:hypothetical protein F5Y09DRAFT_355737 [Xylaria sp. FL1042]|nr:hypothetical protein F5Y09DRAFT_355737 [Xylaria sp. FL1042]
MSEATQRRFPVAPKACMIVAFNELRDRILPLAELQYWIPYHICLLKRGDIKLRESFHIFELGYERALKLSKEQIRAYMRRVDIDDLEGFSVQVIERLGDLDGLYDISSGWTTDEDEDTVINIYPDNNNNDTALYDENGFLIERENGGESNHLSTPALSSSDHDLEGEMEVGIPPLLSPTLPEFELSEESNSSEDPMSLKSSISHIFLTEGLDDISPSQASSTYSSDNGGDKSISPELEELLREMGVRVLPTRTNKEVRLFEDEFAHLDKKWKLAAARWDEQSEGGRQEEAWEETQHLDASDPTHGLFNWQVEGLFLCRLAELVHQVNFLEARATYLHWRWRSENPLPPSQRLPKRSHSSLRNELVE